MIEKLKSSRRHPMIAIFGWGSLLVVILVFVFWGVSRGTGQGIQVGGAAAQVNSQLITLKDLSEMIEILQRQQNQQGMTQKASPRQDLEQQALSTLIEFELAVQIAKKGGVLVSDEQVRDFITSIPAFQEEGKFRRDRYSAYLQNTGRTPAEFEDRVRREELVQETQRLLQIATRPSELELKLRKEVGDTKANLEFVRFSPETFGDSSKIVSEKDATAFLAIPENLKRAQEKYDATKAEYTKGEEVRARHVLFKTAQGDTASEKAALEKARDVIKRVREKKEDFAKLAQSLSEDTGSKSQGGDLGYFGRGRMVPEFENAAFAMKENDVSEPIKTQFGYHVLQRLQFRPGSVTTFEQAKTSIAKKMIAEDLASKKSDELKAVLKKGDGNAVQAWVTANKLKWEETGSFTLESEMIPKIGMNDEMGRIAFTLTEAKPYPADLIRQGPVAYLIRHKAVSAVNKEKDPMAQMTALFERPELMAQMTAQSRAGSSFRRWVDEYKVKSKIHVNEGMKHQKSLSDSPI